MCICMIWNERRRVYSKEYKERHCTSFAQADENPLLSVVAAAASRQGIDQRRVAGEREWERERMRERERWWCGGGDPSLAAPTRLATACTQIGRTNYQPLKILTKFINLTVWFKIEQAKERIFSFFINKTKRFTIMRFIDETNTLILLYLCLPYNLCLINILQFKKSLMLFYIVCMQINTKQVY
jgi:hypothetical protein